MQNKLIAILAVLVSWSVSSPAQQIDRDDMAGGGNSRPVKDMGGPSSRPVFVSGRVVLGHGSPPDELVAIERVCNGRRTPESYTDPKGYFSFQIGADLTVATSDASASGEDLGRPGYAGTPGLPGFGRGGSRAAFDQDSTTNADLQSCELRFSMPGYEMATIDLGFRPVTDSLNLGTIALRRLADVKGHTVSVTTLAAPKKAKRSYDKAVQELRNKRPNPQKAAKELEKAVREHPEFAAAWHLLGRIRERRRDVEGARQAFEKALVADPNYLSPHFQFDV